jgi:hypothetical protein
MRFTNPSPADIQRLLKTAKSIAVVGLSPRPHRPSHSVARAMQGFGYRIVPVRPAVDAVLGEKAYPDLAALPGPVDIVDVFRAPEFVDGIVSQCIARKFPALWLQEGVVDEVAAERAQAAGIFVVMDRCIYKEYVLLMGNRVRTSS